MRGPRGAPRETGKKKRSRAAVVPLRESRMAIVIAVARAMYRGEKYRRVETKAKMSLDLGRNYEDHNGRRYVGLFGILKNPQALAGKSNLKDFRRESGDRLEGRIKNANETRLHVILP